MFLNKFKLKKIRLLDVTFENEIQPWEVEAFRGAVIATAGRDHILFHNHEKEGYRYSYPLIQYKRINKKPHLFCIEEGVDDIHHFFSNKQEGIMLGNRPYELKVDEISLTNFILKVNTKTNTYKLNNWLPLNQKNITTYNTLNNEMEQFEFLEKILVGNILSMAKGLNWFIKEKINLRIKSVYGKQITKKGKKLLALNIVFISNITLPDHLGLGKNSSLGYGIINKSNGK